MSRLHAPTTHELMAESRSLNEPCTLYVCMSCRRSGAPREPKEQRPGFILYHQLAKALEASELRGAFEIQPAECLSVCPRPCGIALSMPEGWTYLFGDQMPDATVEDILECLRLYLDSPKGYMERKNRPRSLQASVLGRIPPIARRYACI